MNVMLVSQCSKRALVETRRILDQFAERKGSRTWQTSITRQGLLTLRKMLRKTARRNTAVACHWIKSGNRTELVWIVGNLRKFNELGTVPTNTTLRDVLRSKDENQWHKSEDIALLAGIAALFHDFGKAMSPFQKKLRSKAVTSEPYRHEWVSVRIFQAFVGNLSDREWMEKLRSVDGNFDERSLIDSLVCDMPGKAGNPFKEMDAPLARMVCWLIVSHHRLPKWPGGSGDAGEPRLKKIDKWLIKKFDPSWNYERCSTEKRGAKELHDAWRFPKGLPLRSNVWQSRARSTAARALKRPEFLDGKKDWLKDTFSMHLSRMFLMLADHIYSAHEETPRWQDGKYKAFANTDRDTGKLKQKLDEHLVGVGHHAVLLARMLPVYKRSLPSISRHRGFKKRNVNKGYRWQDKSYELACGLKKRAAMHGFFGVNMASTGCGKTLANGRIMYGLSDEQLGCRFNVALGLRTLTLQTGDSLRERLHLQEDDLAVLVGSQAVRQLHELENQNEQPSEARLAFENAGSESSEELFGADQYVRYEGALDDGLLGKWIRQNSRLHQLVSAPSWSAPLTI